MKINGEKLSYYRKKKKLSQEELGKKLNVSKQMLSFWEREEQPISPKYYEDLEKILAINIDDLFDSKNDLEEAIYNTPNLTPEQKRELILHIKKMEIETRMPIEKNKNEVPLIGTINVDTNRLELNKDQLSAKEFLLVEQFRELEKAEQERILADMSNHFLETNDK